MQNPDDGRFRGDDLSGHLRLFLGTAGALFLPVWLVLAGMIAQLDPSLQAGAIITEAGHIAIVEYTAWEKFWWGGIKAAGVVSFGGSLLVIGMVALSLVAEWRDRATVRMAALERIDDGTGAFLEPVSYEVRRTTVKAAAEPDHAVEPGERQPEEPSEPSAEPPAPFVPRLVEPAPEPVADTRHAAGASIDPGEPVVANGAADDDVDRLFQ